MDENRELLMQIAEMMEQQTKALSEQIRKLEIKVKNDVAGCIDARCFTGAGTA